MPLAKIHIRQGRYGEARLSKVSGAIQAALMNTLGVPPEDFYQLIFEFPANRFLHTPSFVGMNYSDDLIILDVTFIQGRPKETRLALLKDLNGRVAAAAGVSPDDMLITLYEVPGENISFGEGEAQRANAVARAETRGRRRRSRRNGKEWECDMSEAIARASVTSRTIVVEHIRISSDRPFAEVRRKLEATVPRLDTGIAEALGAGDQKRAKDYEEN